MRICITISNSFMRIIVSYDIFDIFDSFVNPICPGVILSNKAPREGGTWCSSCANPDKNMVLT